MTLCLLRRKDLPPGASLVQRIHWAVQVYELGPAMCGSIKASQGLMGFILILSGPCQMIRSKDALREEFLDAFFRMINMEPVRRC